MSLFRSIILINTPRDPHEQATSFDTELRNH